MKTFKILPLLLATCGLLWASGPIQAADKPNIVLVFMDNFGWGEPGFNGGGIIRGAPTPRLDQLASEGVRLTNFNVESQCTPSRAAIMTGQSFYLRPTFTIGADRPTDYGIEVGYKWIGW